MILNRISILNYKNIEQTDLTFSSKLNCFFGQNGMGKTNLLDAIYYLSFCKSAGNPIDSQNMLHTAEFFMIQGAYSTDDGRPEEIFCGMKRRQKKQFKRNKKEYHRLSDHIGLIPLVMVSPDDSILIAGGSEERRKFMDVVISQYDKEYLEALIRYNKALAQRNILLKKEEEVDDEMLAIWEEMMAQEGEVVFRKRESFIQEFIPIFQQFYSYISEDKEVVGLTYESHARNNSLKEIIFRLPRPFIKLFKYETLVSFYNRVIGLYTRSSSRIGLRDEMSEQAERYWIYKDEINDLTELAYEGLIVPAPRNYDAILSRIYGEYMKFPPPSERGKWHDGTLTFEPDMPYIVYLAREKRN